MTTKAALDPKTYTRNFSKTPEWFIKNALGQRLWGKPGEPGQVEIVRSVFANRRTSVCGCVGSSKTFVAAMIALAWLYRRPDAKVYTFAPTHRQIKRILWPEIHRGYSQAKVKLGGHINETELKLGPNWYAVGWSTDQPGNVHGIHGPCNLILVDEAQEIPRPIWDALENAMADGITKMLLLFNPTTLSGEAYDSFHSKRSLYNQIRISAFDTPNVKARRMIYPGMITLEQIKAWKRTYDEGSDFYQIKVMGNFPSQEPNTLVPLNWIEKAHNRKRDLIGGNIGGGDVARYGDDDSVLAPLEGRHLKVSIVLKKNDTMEVSGKWKKWYFDNKASLLVVDEIGIGSGVVDRLREQKVHVIGMNVSEKADDSKRFKNKRTENLWAFRCALDPKNPNAISMEKEPERDEEICAVKFKINSAGQIEAESKDKMKARLGRSPDRLDAAVNAVVGLRFRDVGDYKAEAEEYTSGLEAEMGDVIEGFEEDGRGYMSGLIDE